MALSNTDLKKGVIFQLDGQPYQVVEYSQKVMGRGGSIVNVKIKNLIDGKVLQKTFKGGESINSADITTRKIQYLYKDTVYHFMDQQTYDQLELAVTGNDKLAGFLKDGDEVRGQLFAGRLVGIDLPKNLPIKVTYTEAAVRGDTSTAITKDATLETGLVVKVPAFIKTGDIISVDTTTGNYRGRV